jgi:hypothetical protein
VSLSGKKTLRQGELESRENNVVSLGIQSSPIWHCERGRADVEHVPDALAHGEGRLPALQLHNLVQWRAPSPLDRKNQSITPIHPGKSIRSNGKSKELVDLSLFRLVFEKILNF